VAGPAGPATHFLLTGPTRDKHAAGGGDACIAGEKVEPEDFSPSAQRAHDK